MAGLLYKELVLNRRNIISMAVAELVISSVIFMPLFDDGVHEEADILVSLISTVMIPVMFLSLGMIAGFFEVDETKKWAYFISSSPITQTGHIRTKYIFTFLMYTALLVWCYYLSAFAAVLGGSINMSIAVFMQWIMLIFNAVEFPFMVRFGTKAGGYIKSAFMIALMLIIIEYALFGDFSTDSEKIFKFIERLSGTTAMSDIMCILSALFPCAAVGLYFLSYKISCKLFLKGAEEYDR